MNAQLPAPGEIVLDHVGWFLPDMGAAERELTAAGFKLTPFTHQMNRTEAGEVPAGTANRCAMLQRGYLEFLTAVADTPLATQFRAQLARYTGLHLLAFAVADPAAAHKRLRRAGFEPAAPVALRRSVELDNGSTAEAAFTVLRLPPGTMAEGRIQLVTHHTPELVWQSRWVRHANDIQTLEGALLAVADPRKAAERFARFLDRPVEPLGDGRFRLTLDRGVLVLAPATWVDEHVAALPAEPPVIAAVALGAPHDAARVPVSGAAGAAVTFGVFGVPPTWAT